MYYELINDISLHTNKLKAITIESTDCYLQNDLIKRHSNEKYRIHFGYIYYMYIYPTLTLTVRTTRSYRSLYLSLACFLIKKFRYITNNVIWRNFFILIVSSIDTADCFRKGVIYRPISKLD